MSRRIVLSAVLIVGVLSIAAGAWQQPARGGGGLTATPSVDALQVEKLAENLFVLRGGGGNTAAFVSSTGVVLVDTKVSGWGQSILAKLKTLTDKPITTIVNTHTHFDHVNGNAELPTVEVVTHQNTKTYMEQWNPIFGFPGDFPSPFKASGGKGLPTRTFSDRLTLGRGGDRVDLYYYGRAHTGGDAYVVFTAARVMHAGDTFPNKTTPIMDRNNGGSGVAYAGTLARAAATPEVDRVITGHSAVVSTAELKEYSEFIRELVGAVQEAKKAGRTVDDVVSAWKVPARFKGYNQPQPGSLRANVQVIWDETK
jgi:glyoxylase-like metal-dependent hydrolase (beta-lactamase superfamily II)